MIVAFAVDPEALPMPSSDAPIRRATHLRLLECWHKFGILVYAGADGFDATPLARAIEDLPQDVRTLWKNVVKHGRKRAAPSGATDLAAVHEARDLAPFSGHIHLACMHEVRAGLLGLPADAASLRLPEVDLEICRLDCADQTVAFGRAAELADAPIAKDELVTDVWRERFERLAAVAKNVVLIDRYAVDGLAKRGRGSGLRRLLANLDAGARQVGLRVYTSPLGSDETTLRTLIEDAMRDLARGGIRELRVYLAADDVFRRKAHARFLRFDDAVCKVDIGIELLQGERVWRACEFAMRPRRDEDREREKALELAAGSHVLTWPVAPDGRP